MPAGRDSGFGITHLFQLFTVAAHPAPFKILPPLVYRCRDWYPITPEEAEVATAITPKSVLKSRWREPGDCPIHSRTTLRIVGIDRVSHRK